MDPTTEKPVTTPLHTGRPAVIRGIVLRLLFALGLLAGAATTQYVLTGSRLAKLQSKSALINLAGRQRMLILQAELLLRQGMDFHERNEKRALLKELREVESQLARAHRAMLEGDPALGVPPASSALRAIYEDEPHQLDLRMRQFRQSLRARSAIAGDGTSPTDRTGQTDNYHALLVGLETAVAANERDLDVSIRALQVARIAVFAGTLSLLALAGLGVFWPMVKRIRSETDQRDQQSHQLSEALDELRQQRDERRQRMRAMVSIMEDLEEERGALEREIQARENVQQALQQSEQVFQAIVESAPAAMVMIDPAGKIALVNAETERLFQYNRSELLGSPVEKLIPQQFRAEHPKYRTQFIKQPSARPMGAGRDLNGRRRDGSEVPVEIGLTPIDAEEGVFVLSTIVDITERKQTEREVRRINEELLKKNEEVQQFVYTVSHDLKSPLVTCKGFVGVAREDLKDGLLDEVDSSLGRIEHATQRMAQLIEDLLQLSRVGTIRTDPQDVDVRQLVEATVADLASQIDDAGAVVSIQHDLPCVLADRTRLAQVFENLISNAIKYGCGSPNPEISVEGFVDGGEVRICVRDNGVGIAPRFHDKVFGLFERLESDKEGTGIGLAAVARIMDLHRGRAWVESDIGQGATFWLSFPAGHAAVTKRLT